MQPERHPDSSPAAHDHSTPPQPIDYRPGGPPAKSQWMTDDEAYGGCLVYGLLGLTAVGAVAGVVGWLIWMLLGFF